jgi:hypothetical protein
MPSARVKGSVDAVPPASAVLSTRSPHGAAKADFVGDRSADPVRRYPTMACFSLSEGSKARPLTLHVATWSDLSESVRSSQPGPFPPHFRQEMRFSRPRVSSINRCPLGACLRRVRRSPPPFSRLCRLRAGFRRSASPPLELPSGPRSRGSPSSVRQKAALPAVRGFRPERSADWIHRLSTSAIATVPEHDSGRDHHPASFAGSYPPALLLCGQRCVFRRVAGRAIVGSGAVVHFTVPAAPPSAEAWELCPDLDQPGHLMSRTRVHAGRRSQTQRLWDRVPTSSPADDARPSAPGLHFPIFREEGQDLRTRGAFRRWAAPKGWLRDSTDCHQPVE